MSLKNFNAISIYSTNLIQREEPEFSFFPTNCLPEINDRKMNTVVAEIPVSKTKHFSKV